MQKKSFPAYGVYSVLPSIFPGKGQEKLVIICINEERKCYEMQCQAGRCFFGFGKGVFCLTQPI
jgi:hypothetical protein